jgi:hypothetical protein
MAEGVVLFMLEEAPKDPKQVFSGLDVSSNTLKVPPVARHYRDSLQSIESVVCFEE